MTHDFPRPIAICGALSWEVRPVIRVLRQVRKLVVGGVRTWQGTSALGPVVVFRAGMGPQRAAAAAEAVLGGLRPAVLLNTGCCGALHPELRRGRLVVPGTLRWLDGQVPEIQSDLTWADTLRGHAGEGWDGGPQATSAEVLLSAAAKRAAHEQSGATAVDMEGAALAAVAARFELPFASVRVVLDDAHADLPDLRDLTDAAGDVRPLRAAVRVARNPLELKRFLELQAASREVESSLEKFFKKLFPNRG